MIVRPDNWIFLILIYFSLECFIGIVMIENWWVLPAVILLQVIYKLRSISLVMAFIWSLGTRFVKLDLETADGIQNFRLLL